MFWPSGEDISIVLKDIFPLVESYLGLCPISCPIMKSMPPLRFHKVGLKLVSEKNLNELIIALEKSSGAT